MAVAVAYPSWHPHVDVWLLVAALSASCAVVVVRVGPRCAGPGARRCWLQAGVLRPRGARDLVRPTGPCTTSPSGTTTACTWCSTSCCPWLRHRSCCSERRRGCCVILRPPSLLFRAVRLFSRFLPALLVFNVVLVLTHWPALVDFSLGSGLAHFLVHALVFVTALVVWMPVLSPLPEIPRLSATPDALPVRPVDRADDPGVVPDVRGARRSTASTRASRISGGFRPSTTSAWPA